MNNQDEIKAYLAQLITEAMYMDAEELQEDQLFSDFGLESVSLARILEKICKKYNCNIQINEFLPHQTLNDATLYLAEKLLHKTIR